MKFPKLNWTMILSVIIGVAIYFIVKGMFFTDTVDENTLEVTSEFRGLGQPHMRRVA